MNHNAKCLCGELTIRCHGSPLKTSLCHCNACRKQTGSAFGIAVFYKRDAVEINGKSTVFERSSDAGFKITTHFCPVCGSTLYWYPERMPELVAIGSGTFDENVFPEPDQEVYTNNRWSWVQPLSSS